MATQNIVVYTPEQYFFYQLIAENPEAFLWILSIFGLLVVGAGIMGIHQRYKFKKKYTYFG